jgi:hypothetical protein
VVEFHIKVRFRVFSFESYSEYKSVLFGRAEGADDAAAVVALARAALTRRVRTVGAEDRPTLLLTHEARREI